MEELDKQIQIAILAKEKPEKIKMVEEALHGITNEQVTG